MQNFISLGSCINPFTYTEKVAPVDISDLEQEVGVVSEGNLNDVVLKLMCERNEAVVTSVLL